MSEAPLANQLSTAPVAHDPARAERTLRELTAALPGAEALAGAPVRRLLEGVFGCSPYLAALALRDPARLMRCLTQPPETHAAQLAASVHTAAGAAEQLSGLMPALRQYKAEIALLTALADAGGVWPVMRVTEALAHCADTALAATVRFLFARAVRAGQWLAAGPAVAETSGYFVLAMGKHGAHELNYSSDIDLIVFFDPDKTRLAAGIDPQGFYVRLTRDLVKAMQEPTADGYVFRTDLRLRPDPGSTQIALSCHAALQYYESFGQNWERAALIKARAVAGDIAAGQEFLEELSPYIWRRYLDFAAIADVHAMKRQIHAVKGFSDIRVAGHNIKLGRGGIREIEFFAQTQQLIAGGRQRELRTSQTLVALERLAARGWIEPQVTEELTAAYTHLRTVEHRLQMIADEQTQTLPEEPDALLQVARFCGYADVEGFGAALTATLKTVQRHYEKLFEHVPDLTAGTGNMMFVGDDHDPATLETLRRLGYADPAAAVGIVKGWHFGRYPAMRSARARERLTEVQPVLLEALGVTGDGNTTLAAFDRFLAELPAGVQLFSLLRSNPKLLSLLAAILGSAPRLAQMLSRRSRLLDAVLDPGFFGAVPSGDDFSRRVAEDLRTVAGLDEKLDRARVIGSELAFLIGVRVLTDTISAEQAGGAYARLAEGMIAEMHAAVTADMERVHGRLPGGASAVIAMGKLGGREMAANSDLDLIVVYDYAVGDAPSDGPKPLAGQLYYARLTQRLIAALSVATAEGKLYDVDMRLRPSGSKGPVATHVTAFATYQHDTAWTWEHMALTRARVVAGARQLKAQVEDVVRDVLTTPRDAAKVVADIADMRRRLEEAKGTVDPWNLKQVRGGLVDVEFIAQTLQLLHAPAHPALLDQSTMETLRRARDAGVLSEADAAVLIPALALYQSLAQVLRLCVDGAFAPGAAPAGLKALLARAAAVPDFTRLEADLKDTQAAVAEVFGRLIGGRA